MLCLLPGAPNFQRWNCDVTQSQRVGNTRHVLPGPPYDSVITSYSIIGILPRTGGKVQIQPSISALLTIISLSSDPSTLALKAVVSGSRFQHRVGKIWFGIRLRSLSRSSDPIRGSASGHRMIRAPDHDQYMTRGEDGGRFAPDQSWGWSWPRELRGHRTLRR
jgi:hypothetical protein